MENDLSGYFTFAAGVAVGIVLMSLKPLFNAAQKRRTEMVAARSRILAGIKEKHDEEILNEAFRTAEAIKGELDKSLQTLKRTLHAVMPAEAGKPGPTAKPVIDLANPVESNTATS